MPPSALSSEAAQPPAQSAGAATPRRPGAALWGLALVYVAVAAGVVYALAAAGVDRLLWPVAGALALVLALALLVLRRAVKAQRAVQAGGEILSQAFDALPHPRLIVDRDGNAVAVNPAFTEMFGYDGKAPLAALEARLGLGERAAQEIRRLAANVAAGSAARAEIMVPSDSGKDDWYDVAVSPIADRSGHVMWRIEDVTARHQLEQIIREEHEILFDFLENAPVGFYSVNEEGKFLFINDTLAGWLGYAPEEILGGNLRLHDFMAAAPASGLAPYEPGGGGEETQPGEIILRGRHGRALHAHIGQSIVKDAEGKRLRTRSVVRDLSREREWAQALRQSERRFARFFEDAPVGIALVDADGVITECNRSLRQIMAPTGDQVVGLPFLDFVARDDLALAESGVREVVSGSDMDAPLQIRLHGEGERVASLFVSRLEDGGSDRPGLILHVLDTTELRDLEVRAARSQKMEAVGQLAGGIAHDFNNLLTAMIGFCDLLLLRHRPGEQSFADIMQIKQNANRAANLVRQLLAFTRQQTLQPKVLNLTDVLVELSNLLRRLLGENLEFKMIHGRDLGLVKVDQGQFEQVIVNLAVNARDAMAAGGTLTIRTGNVTSAEPIRRGLEDMPPGEYVLVEVADTGKGISDEQLDRIFEPFFSTKEVGAGTGLGLSTVHGIVKQAGGYILVDSVVNQGTKFSIFMPRYEAEEEAARPDAGGEAVTVGDLTGAGTVLLVEDEDAVRLFGARALRNKGYKVLEAKGGNTAIELLKAAQEPIDLLITDIVMPDMDGPTLIAWVRRNRPAMPVVCISGYAEETFRKQLGSSSEVDFLPKPFSLEQLAGKVKSILGPARGGVPREPTATPTGHP